METIEINSQNKIKTSVKDFFLNLGAFVALYTVIVALLNLLFTVINKAYPQISNGYDYYGSYSTSISWPVAVLVVSFPILILLMWFLGKDYDREPEKKNVGVHKWLTYITLFVSGITLASDLTTVLYYFIDGQELTTGFLLKILVVFIVAANIFLYYISDIRGKLTSQSRKIWRIVAGVIVVGSIIWGFSVLGSPYTQRLIKYDEQKVSDLQNLNNQVSSYYQVNKALPLAMDDLSKTNYYNQIPLDQQTQKPYEYKKIDNKSYSLCAEFNKSTDNLSNSDANRLYKSASLYGNNFWIHPAGHYCVSQSIDSSGVTYPIPILLKSN